VWSLFDAVASNAGIQLFGPAFIFKNHTGNCRQLVKHILNTWQSLQESSNLSEQNVEWNPTVRVASSNMLTDINMEWLQKCTTNAITSNKRVSETKH
jgi:hypothetical protein